jgi:outer membrane protein assembly factor BamA
LNLVHITQATQSLVKSVDKWYGLIIVSILCISMSSFIKRVGLIGLIFTLAPFSVSWAQSKLDSAIIIDAVQCKGNNRTQDKIVTRELEFKAGDTIYISDTARAFKHIVEKLYNQRLFNKIQVALVKQYQAKNGIKHANLLITVKERWFTFPIPLVELADRSFNEWYYNQGAKLNRLNYGLRFKQDNLTRNNDPLKIGLQLGFTRRAEVSYRFPYLDSNQKGGLSINVAYSTNVSAAAYSIDNKQKFINGELKTLRVRRLAGLGYTRRVGFYTLMEVGVYYNRNSVADTIIRANPEYYGDGRNTQRFWQLRLSYSYDRRNYQRFATKGYFLAAELEQNGFWPTDALFQTAFRLRASKYFTLSKRWFLASGADAAIALQNRMPYANLYGIGYNLRFVRGYDAQVIEAPQSIIWKNSLRFKFFQRVYNNKFIPLEQFKTMPITCYLKVFSDAGYGRNVYVTDSNKPLTNKLIPGYGIGLDVVSFYDLVLRFEYAYNFLARPGFYFYIGADI